MKHSYYNVVSKLDDDTSLLYNTYWESLAVLDEDELAAYREVESASEDELQSPLMCQLAQQHFIIDNPEDEADWIQYEYEKDKFNNRVFELVICPTIDCNFRCPYCYEKKRPGMMPLDIQDAVVRFVEECYEELPFLEMRVTWYGGEPLLGADVIEYLSGHFLSFCEKHDIPYHASIMTNGSLADKCMMDRMYACGVKSMMITFGGKGELHDRQRPSVDGSPTYETILENTKRILADGTPVNIECVYDSENLESLVELAGDFARGENSENVYMHYPYPKTDYNNDLVDEDGNQLFDLKAQLKQRASAFEQLHFAAGFDSKRWHSIIRPLHHFCGAHTERDYIIDELGGVYKCMCDMDKPETHQIFNVLDDPDKRKFNLKKLMYYMSYNPVRSKPCRTCRVMPICKGSCFIDHDPERYWVPTSCHPIKVAIVDYVRAYYEALVEEGRI